MFFRAPFPLSKKNNSRFFSHLTPRIHIFTKIHYISIHCPPSLGSRDPCKWGYENLCLKPLGSRNSRNGKKNTKTAWKTWNPTKSTPNTWCVQLNLPNKKTTNNTHLQLPSTSFHQPSSINAKLTPPRRAWTKAAPKRSNSLRSPPKATTVRMANKHSLGGPEGMVEGEDVSNNGQERCSLFVGRQFFFRKFYQGFIEEDLAEIKWDKRFQQKMKRDNHQLIQSEFHSSFGAHKRPVHCWDGIIY